MFKLITSCKEATRLISEELEHPLPLFKRIALKSHLVMCQHCVNFEKQLKVLRNIFASHPQSELSTGSESLQKTAESEGVALSAEARHQIKSALRKHQTSQE